MKNEDKLKWMRGATAMVGLPVLSQDPHALELIMAAYDGVLKKGGQFTLDDAATIRVELSEKYKKQIQEEIKKEVTPELLHECEKQKEQYINDIGELVIIHNELFKLLDIVPDEGSIYNPGADIFYKVELPTGKIGLISTLVRLFSLKSVMPDEWYQTIKSNW